MPSSESDWAGHSLFEGPAGSGHSWSVEEGDDRLVTAQSLTLPGDFDLVARCRAGDRSAWKALHDENFKFVWKVARRLGTPPEELDDVCQEVFLVAFRKLDQFEQGLFTTWLYRITANIVSGRHRRRRVLRALKSVLVVGAGDRIQSRTPQQDVEARELEAQVALVLESMSPKKREVFALFELEGWSGEEIAERVGCTVATVWTRLYHARKDFERIARKRGLLS